MVYFIWKFKVFTFLTDWILGADIFLRDVKCVVVRCDLIYCGGSLLMFCRNLVLLFSGRMNTRNISRGRNSLTAIQPFTQWCCRFQYHVCKRLSLDQLLNHMDVICLPTVLLKTILILFLHLCLCSLGGVFIFFIQICYALVKFMHVACPAHLILFGLICNYEMKVVRVQALKQ